MNFRAAIGRAFPLIVFLVVVVGSGLAIGFITRPGNWYEGLIKPSFNPPNWIFAPVWTVLYVLIAVAGWRCFRAGPTGSLMKLWWIQLLLNFAWPPTFFAAHAIGAALGVIVLMFLAILAFIVNAWRRDRIASYLFVPYAAWVAFAASLNAAIVTLN